MRGQGGVKLTDRVRQALGDIGTLGRDVADRVDGLLAQSGRQLASHAPAARLGRELRRAQSRLSSAVAVSDLEEVVQGTSHTLEELSSMLPTSPSPGRFHGRVADAYRRLHAGIGQSSDIILRRLRLGPMPALLAFENGLADNAMVDRDILASLLFATDLSALASDPPGAARWIRAHAVAVGHVTTDATWETLERKILTGNTLLFVEGCSDVLIFDTVKYPARPISPPTNEISIKGSQESFNEVLLTSMNLMRRQIPSPDLRFIQREVGTITRTPVVIAYLENVANPALVRTVKERLDAVDVSDLSPAAMLTGFFEDRPRSLFPQVRTTTRVDEAAHYVLAGRVVLMIDRVPYVMVVPSILLDFYRTSQDYQFTFGEASYVRIIRLIAWFIALYLPPLYVALTSVNPMLMPTGLVLTLSGTREGIPLPPIMEVIIMMLTLEILREAAVRLPKALGQTLGTVAAIVMGTAMAKAGIVSTAMIIVITLTALASFTAPGFEITAPWRILMWPMLAAAYFFGLFGMMLLSYALIGELSSITSLGVPYLTPLAPLRPSGLRDSVIRYPLLALKWRSSTARPVDLLRTEGLPSHLPRPRLLQARRRRRSGERT